MNNFIELTLASNHKPVYINYKHITYVTTYTPQYNNQTITEIHIIKEKSTIYVTESPETILIKIDSLTN